jgi:hypothetical protein
MRFLAMTQELRDSQVYNVFFQDHDGRLDSVGCAKSEFRATLLARCWSEQRQATTVVVRKLPNGETKNLYRFQYRGMGEVSRFDMSVARA